MRRKLITLSALLGSFILGVCAQIIWLSSLGPDRHAPKSLQGTISQNYEMTGYYYPDDEFPWAFDNLNRIDLTTADFRINSDSSALRIPKVPSGYLITDYWVYKLSSVNIDGNRISFITEASAGISYQFTGTMLEGDYVIRGFSQYIVGRSIMVDGRIVRMLFGFKISEREVRFIKGSGC